MVQLGKIYEKSREQQCVYVYNGLEMLFLHGLSAQYSPNFHYRNLWHFSHILLEEAMLNFKQ